MIMIVILFGGSTRSNGLGGRLNRMRRMEVVCTEFSGSTEATGTSDEIVSLTEGCATETVSYRFLALTFHHQISLVDLVASNRVPEVMLHQSECGQQELLLLGSRVLRGSQPVISSSQASSGASVCVVRSRNVLCGKRLTMSRKLMASVSAMLHNLFSDSERERRRRTAHRTREVPSVIQTTPFIRSPSAVVSRS